MAPLPRGGGLAVGDVVKAIKGSRKGEGRRKGGHHQYGAAAVAAQRVVGDAEKRSGEQGRCWVGTAQAARSTTTPKES
eukprot:354830-Chlamydomonas_euryale.AAC.3